MADVTDPTSPSVTASCCGEPRVTRALDVCYDHAKLCEVCRREPSVDGTCPACASGDTPEQEEDR